MLLLRSSRNFKAFENVLKAKEVREKFRSLRIKESSTFQNSIAKVLSLFNMPDITCIVLWRKLAEVEKHIEHKIIRCWGVKEFLVCAGNKVRLGKSPSAQPISSSEAVICLEFHSFLLLLC